MNDFIELMNYNNEVVDNPAPQVVYVPDKNTAEDQLEYGPELYLFEVFNRSILGHLAAIGQEYVEQLPYADPVTGVTDLSDKLHKLAIVAAKFHDFVLTNRDVLEPGGPA